MNENLSWQTLDISLEIISHKFRRLNFKEKVFNCISTCTRNNIFKLLVVKIDRMMLLI